MASRSVSCCIAKPHLLHSISASYFRDIFQMMIIPRVGIVLISLAPWAQLSIPPLRRVSSSAAEEALRSGVVPFLRTTVSSSTVTSITGWITSWSSTPGVSSGVIGGMSWRVMVSFSKSYLVPSDKIFSHRKKREFTYVIRFISLCVSRTASSQRGWNGGLSCCQRACWCSRVLNRRRGRPEQCAVTKVIGPALFFIFSYIFVCLISLFLFMSDCYRLFWVD